MAEDDAADADFLLRGSRRESGAQLERQRTSDAQRPVTVSGGMQRHGVVAMPGSFCSPEPGSGRVAAVPSMRMLACLSLSVLSRPVAANFTQAYSFSI